MRLDVLLQTRHNEHTRSHISHWIKQGRVTVNGKKLTKAGSKVEETDEIIVEEGEVYETSVTPIKMDLDIIFECDDYLVINKPRGLIVHPGDGTKGKATLVHGLMYYTQSLSSSNGVDRPGIVHRLDKDTSGVMIVAKNDIFHAFLSKQIQDREVKKEYRAIVHKNPQDGEIIAPVGRNMRNRQKMCVMEGGKYAKTLVSNISFDPEYNVSFLEVEIITGRTHQIRVHLSSIHFPVIGDIVYGDAKMNKLFAQKFGVKHQLLHAYKYSFHDKDGVLQSFSAEPKEALLQKGENNPLFEF
ncbi:RNA pseudouridine synthase [Candidatus Peregrinibacteria bacterium]|nr:MAG: RNA pseudouridine synthase [Candidatus Peregrinibacteria bacterium]